MTEATEAMKRDIGARFVRRQRLVAAQVGLVALGLFLFKDKLAALLDWFETQIGPRLPLLPDESGAISWRWAALTAMLVALLSWARSAGREPEAAAALSRAQWSFKLGRLPIEIDVGLNITRPTFWLLLAGVGLGCALIGAGDGTLLGRLVIVTGFLTVAWLVWVRLPMAGAATTLRLYLHRVAVCDVQNRCSDKPGGLAVYPLGRAIAQGGWLKPSLTLSVVMLPVSAGIAFGLVQFDGTPPYTMPDVVVALSIAIAGGSATLALARRAAIGLWRAPDQSWSNSLTPLGDILFGALASSLSLSLWELGTRLTDPGLSMVLPGAVFSGAVACI
jgi:hypothetical protein